MMTSADDQNFDLRIDYCPRFNPLIHLTKAILTFGAEIQLRLMRHLKPSLSRKRHMIYDAFGLAVNILLGYTRSSYRKGVNHCLPLSVCPKSCHQLLLDNGNFAAKWRKNFKNSNSVNDRNRGRQLRQFRQHCQGQIKTFVGLGLRMNCDENMVWRMGGGFPVDTGKDRERDTNPDFFLLILGLEMRILGEFR